MEEQRGKFENKEIFLPKSKKRRRWEYIIPLILGIIFVCVYFGINLINWSKNNKELNKLSAVSGITSNLPLAEATATPTPPPLGPHIEAATIDISGTVWTAEDKSGNLGSGKNISLSYNGGAKSTVATGAGGTFTFSSISVAVGTPYIIFVDDGGTDHGNLVTLAKESNTSGLDVYTNHIVLRHESAGPLSNANLGTAAGSADPEIQYTYAAPNITFNNGYTVWVENSKTYTPGGTVTADDFKIPGSGVFNAAANNITIHGSWSVDATSTLTITTGGAQATTFDSGSSETFASGGTDGNHDFNNFTWSGAGTLTLNSAGMNVSGTFTSSNGTFKSTSGTLYINNTFSASNGTFDSNGGTVEFDTISTSYTITPNNNSFNNVTFDRLAGSISNDINMTLAAAFTINGNLVGKCEHATAGKNLNVIVASGNPIITVNGNVSLPDTPGLSGSIKIGSTTAGNNWTLEAKGDITISDSTAYLYTHVKMDSTAHDQALGLSTGTVSTGNWEIADSGYTVTLTGNLVPAGSATFTLTSGGFNLQNNNFNFGGTLLLTTGTFTHGSGTMTIGGAFTMNNGTFNGGAGDITTGDYATVAINNGSFRSTSGNFKAKGSFTRAASATFDANSGTFIFDLIGSATYTITTNNCTFYNVVFDKDAVAFNTTGILADSFSVGGDLTGKADNNNNLTIRSQSSANPTITINGHLNFPSTAATGDIIFGSTAAAEKFNVVVLKGNFTLNDGDIYFYTDVTLDNQLADQIVTTSAYGAINGNWIIDKNAFTARWDTNMTISGSTYNFTLTSGTVNLQSNTLSITGDYIQTNGTFNGTSGGLTLSSATSNFTVSGGTFNSPANMTAPNYFTLSGTSTFNAPTGILTVKNSFSRAGTVNFNHSSGTVILDDSTNIGYTLTTNNILFNNLTITRTGGGVLTYYFYQQDSYTVAGNLSIKNEQAQTFEIRGHNGGAIHPTVTVNGNIDFPSTVAAGTLNYGEGTYYFSLNVKGNFSMSDGNVVNRTNTTFSGTAADQTITISAGTYSTTSWTVDNGGGSFAVKPANAITINNLTITSGVWYTNGQNLTVSTTFSNDGTFRLQGGEATLTFTRDTNSGTVEYVGDGGATGYGSLLYGDTYWNLIINSTSGSNTWTLNHSLDVNGPNGIAITKGTMATGGFNITDAGNWSRGGSGIFTHGSALVTFDGGDSTTQAFSGDTTFNNFIATASASAGRTLRFAGSSTTIVAGTWTVTGAAGKVITLQSSDSNNWSINAAATSLDYLSVSHSTNTGSTICATHSTGDGTNINWGITGGAGPCGVNISGRVYTDEGKTGDIGSGKTMALSINGGAATTVFTTAGGNFAFSDVTVAANNPVALYISGDALKASLITQAVDASTNISGLELFTAHVVLTHQTAGPMTNDLLATANTIADADMLISTTSHNTTFTAGNKVWVTNAKNYTPGGTVTADSFEVRGTGTFDPGGNDVSIAGSWTISATGSFTSSGTVYFNNASSTQAVITGGADALHDFTNLSINGASNTAQLSTNGISISGTLTTNGANNVFDINGQSINVGTALTNNGKLILKGDEAVVSIAGMDTTHGTVEYNGTGAYPGLKAGGSYNNLSFSAAGSWTADVDININSTLNIAAGTLDGSNKTVTLAASGTPMVIAGAFTPSASTVKYTGAGATNIASATYNNLYLDHAGTTFSAMGDITANSVFTINAGIFDASNKTLTLVGSGTPFVISGTFTPSTSTVKYTGGAATNVSSATYNNLTLDNVLTTFTAAGDMTVNSVLTIASGDFDASNRTITLAGSGTAFLIAGTFTPSTSTIKYTGSAATTITNITYNSLTLDHAGTTFSASGSFEVGGVLNVNSGNLSALNRTITLSGSGTPFIVADTFTPSTSTIKYTGSAATNIAGTTYNNLTLDHVGTTFTALGDITAGSILNINAGTFDASNRTINLTASGTPLLISGSFTPSTSTVNYSGGIATNVANTTYFNIGFSGAGTYSLTAALVVQGVLALSNGTLDTAAGFAITIGEETTTNGSYSQTNGIVNLHNSTIICYGPYSVTAGTYNVGTSNLTLDATPQNFSLVGNGYNFNDINFRNNSGISSRTITLGSAPGQTMNFANFSLDAANSKNMTVSSFTNSPTINISGNIDYIGVGSGAEIISMGNSTWSVNGNVDFSGGAINSNSSTLSLGGSALQTLTSNGQSFYNLVITNNSAAGTTLADSSTITNDFINDTANSKIIFHAGSTYTVTNIDLNGQALGTRVQLRSSVPGTQWLFNTSGTQAVAYVDAQDSNASGGNQINATNNCFNSGNNLNWLFAIASITVAPVSTTLNPGNIQNFVATAYDGMGFPVPGTIFNWSVAAGGGSIDSSGNFTAGAATGTFTNTVQASASGINGYATVIITAAPIPPTPSPTTTATPEQPTKVKVSVPVTIVVDGEGVFDASGSVGYVSYHWDFGDGNQADGAKVIHQYTDINRYNVTLTLKDKNGAETKKNYLVDAVPPIPELTKISSQRKEVTLEGKSHPGTEVILTIKSEPWQTQADANETGKFISKFNFDVTGLNYGEHKIATYAQKQLTSGTILKSGTREYDAIFNLNNGELEAKIKELEERQRRLIIIFIISGIVVIISFLIFFFIWRQKRKKEEKEEKLKLRTGYSQVLTGWNNCDKILSG